MNTIDSGGIPIAPDAGSEVVVANVPPTNTLWRPRLLEIVGYLGVVAVVVLSLVPGSWRPSVGLANVFEHVMAYSVVAAILAAGCRGGWPHAVGLVVLAGVLEIGQVWVPGRDPAMTDFLGSSTGALLGFGLSSLTLARLRKLSGAGRNDASAHPSRSSRIASGGAIILVGAALILISTTTAHGAVGWFGAGLALIMLAIAVIDAIFFLIPDSLNVSALMLGIVNSAVLGRGDLVGVAEAVLRAAVVAVVFFGLRVAYARLRGRHGMGLGDVKLAAVAGIWLSWSILPIAVEIAALSALATYALRRYILCHSLRPTSRLPFGLFLAPAIWVGWLLQTGVLSHW